MEIVAAQKEVRTVFMRGTAGQAVSGLLWLASAALGTWGSPRPGIILLVVAGMFIFPLTQLTLKLFGHSAVLPKTNPFNLLAMLIAFTLPLNLPLVAAAALYNLNWFYPAFMIALGTHYLPFMFLYGMPEFLVLGAVLIGLGVVIAISGPAIFSLGGWVTGLVLLVFAAAELIVVTRQPRPA
jgi:hypothetical protein